MNGLTEKDVEYLNGKGFSLNKVSNSYILPLSNLAYVSVYYSEVNSLVVCMIFSEIDTVTGYGKDAEKAFGTAYFHYRLAYKSITQHIDKLKKIVADTGEAGPDN